MENRDSNKIQKKYTKKEVEEIREKFRHLFEDSNDGIVVHDMNGKIIDVNHRLTDLLGYTREEMLSLRVIDLHPTEKIKPKVKRMDMIQKNGIFRFERLFKKKDGQIIQAEITARMLNIDGEKVVQSLIRDITEQKEAVQKIEMLSKFSEENPNPVIRVTSNYIIEYANLASIGLLHQLQVDIGDLLPDDLLEKIKTIRKVVNIKNHIRSFEYAIGKKIYLFTLSFILDSEKIYVYAQDITARKNHETELKVLNKELSEHINELKQFAYIISHNLRAPVANILGLIELFSQETNQASGLEIKDSLKKAGKNLDTIVQDLNKILVIKKSKVQHKEKVNLEEMLQNVLQILANPVKDADAEITYDFQEVPILFSSATYMQSIFQNMIENAVKYRSPERKLKVQLTSQFIENKILITIKDNGLGIDLEKNRQYLFGLYKQFHRQAKGKGLGLYLVKNQVEALEGTIEVESQVNKGTKFKIYFNKAAADLETDPVDVVKEHQS